MESRIRIRPIDKDISVSKEELRAVLGSALPVRTFPSRSSVGEKNFSHIIGTPAFDLFPFKNESPVIISMGQCNLAQKAIKDVRGRKIMIRMLKDEYRAMVKALADLKIHFRVLNLQEGDKEIGRWLTESGFKNVRFAAAKPTRWQVFPRDVFVYLKAKKILLVHSQLFKLRATRFGDCDVFHTSLAEGGRMLVSGDRLILGRHPEASNRSGEARVLRFLRKKGMKIAKIPLALFYQISRIGRGNRLALFYDHHIDRSASLLRGKNGGYHLVLDPGYRTGPLTNPLPVKESLDLVRMACEKIEVRVHVPKSIHVPYATSLVQFSHGKVLATGGDDELLATIEEIVGIGNLHITEVPVVAYPVFASAGLHCLITENPEPLIDR